MLSDDSYSLNILGLQLRESKCEMSILYQIHSRLNFPTMSGTNIYVLNTIFFFLHEYFSLFLSLSLYILPKCFSFFLFFLLTGLYCYCKLVMCSKYIQERETNCAFRYEWLNYDRKENIKMQIQWIVSKHLHLHFITVHLNFDAALYALLHGQFSVPSMTLFLQPQSTKPMYWIDTEIVMIIRMFHFRYQIFLIA